MADSKLVQQLLTLKELRVTHNRSLTKGRDSLNAAYNDIIALARKLESGETIDEIELDWYDISAPPFAKAHTLYEIIAVGDNKTCNICNTADGMVFPSILYRAGITAGPFHPNCKCGEESYRPIVGYMDALVLTKEDEIATAADINTQYDYEWKTEDTPHVTDEFLRAVYDLSVKHGIKPDDLMAVMAFESWCDPSIQNSIGATGLLQFTRKTASDMGTSADELKSMSAIDQLYYVEKYLFELSAWAGKPETLADLYMITLWPGAVGKKDSYVLWDKNNEDRANYYNQNSGLDIDKDGTITKAEAVRKVLERRDAFERK